MPKKPSWTKDLMLKRGVALVHKFCLINELPPLTIHIVQKQDPLACINACGWYRANAIWLKPWDCAHIGHAGRAWSYPGYVIDRTPYGVLAHELGHHADLSTGDTTYRYSSNYCTQVKDESGEPKLTNYCPNDAEWFAEMFRLFVTNPTLLKEVKPRTHSILSKRFYVVENRPWKTILRQAPQRTIEQTLKKIQSIKG